MRYLGNKTKLIGLIEHVIEKYKIEGETFADLFAGTGSVGDKFKGRYSIIANDFLYYSFILNYAKINNKEIPSFNTFREQYQMDIFDWLNNKTYEPKNNYFFYWNYSPQGERMFFTEENALRIDGNRLDIEELYKDDVININEYYFLLASLIESVSGVSNTSGTYEAFFKFWDSRALKEFKLEPLEIVHVDELFDSQIYCEDTNRLVRRISGDIAYIDTPYTVTQYVSAYHIFETLARYDEPEIKGVGGKRGRGDKNSLYSQRSNAFTAFQDLLRQVNFKHIIISYSNQGLIDLDDMVDLVSKFAVNGVVHVETTDYQPYQNHRGAGQKKKLREVIIYFEKDLTLNKSPLNYSGSKDTLLEPIIKYLPKNVDTFVDVMGGAFNVGANIFALDKVIYNELNPYIFDLIKWLTSCDKNEIIVSTMKVIQEYNLEKGAKEEYLKLREDYNEHQTSEKLFVLHMYSFQNMIRFNNSQKFNTPVGVAGYSNVMEKRIQNFIPKCNNIEYWNLDYVDIDWESFSEGTVFYFDPPYFITQAAYNDGKRGMKGWDIDSETELLSILNKLDRLGHNFMLSNVIEHKDKTHHILLKWVEEHDYNIIDMGTTGWRYAKNEILITNY